MTLTQYALFTTSAYSTCRVLWSSRLPAPTSASSKFADSTRMQPRILKRWNSSATSVLTKSVARKGRKGHLYLPDQTHPGPTPEEEVRIMKRRMQKAERDERMDITLALTPPKTYMGGFTRPRDLRAANWFPGGPYLAKRKVYESPPEAAYEPHTVFILESRHRVRHGVGRVDAKDHVVGVCRAADFVKLMHKYNSRKCPSEGMESMDNACWPWLPKSGKVLRPTRWWGADERLEDILKEIYEDENYKSNDVRQILKEAEDEADEEVTTVFEKPKKKFPMAQQNSSKVTEAGMRANPPQISMDGDIEHGSQLGPSTSEPSSSSLPTSDEAADRSPPPHISGAVPAFYDRANIRDQYLPHLASEPFWLPLIAVTVSTRPLALTLSRLCKAHERGLPFYASMTTDDRKCLYSFSHRMTCMRLNRLHHLTLETIKRLAGHKGGFIGIRFGINEKGRGIDGEALADPIRPDKRIVKILVGKWYSRAEEQYELYKSESQEWGGDDAVNVGYMNEWGRRLDADGQPIALTEEELSTNDVEEMDDEAETDLDPDETDDETIDVDEERLLKAPRVSGMIKFKLKPVLRGEDETATRLRRKLALQNAQHHRSVMQV